MFFCLPSRAAGKAGGGARNQDVHDNGRQIECAYTRPNCTYFR